MNYVFIGFCIITPISVTLHEKLCVQMRFGKVFLYYSINFSYQKLVNRENNKCNLSVKVQTCMTRARGPGSTVPEKYVIG